MKEKTAVRIIREAVPLLQKLVTRLINEQKLPSDYAGSALELAEGILIILGGGRIPGLERQERRGAR